MVSILKQNYRFQDLLLDEAARAEERWDYNLAYHKLTDAVTADKIYQCSLKKLRQKVVCAESVSEFIEEFGYLSETVDYSDLGMMLSFTRASANRKKLKWSYITKHSTVSPRTNK